MRGRGQVRVFDDRMNLLAIIQNAYDIGYELTLNELYRANFTVPADDPKNEHCQPFNYVEVFDGNERLELFRIMPSKLTRNRRGDIVYRCEHVLATLLDDVLFQYHQVGNIGVNTSQVIRYVLDNQLTERWVLGDCDFSRQFEYKWENENLLAALFSIAQPFDEDYIWNFDTTGVPWVINLKKVNADPTSDIIYKKNMTSIEKEVDPSTVVTRLYCLGYGEGVNQLNIKGVNNGLPYLEANTGKYGIKSSILVDRRFESEETLKAYGDRLLDGLKEPYRVYSIGAVDLYRLNPDKYGKFEVGEYVRVIDTEDDINDTFPIVRIVKKDITGRPGEVFIDIANKRRDIAGSISDLQDRARINELYAQGATNQLVVPFADNADDLNPALIRFYIPAEMAKINKLVLNYRFEPFRAYSKAIEGGGAISTSTRDGGSSAPTSESGGGGEVTSDNSQVIQSTTRSGGGAVDTVAGVEIAFGAGYSQLVYTNYAGQGKDWHHTHQVNKHGHRVEIPDHSHEFSLPRHSHDVYIRPHSHRVYIDPHSHRIEIPDHEHDLEFGIYQGSRAGYATVKVDGVVIPQTEPRTDIDIVEYLSTDTAGKIRRNTWHEVEIIPNQMSRIEANIFMQIFTNSRGGGDY